MCLLIPMAIFLWPPAFLWLPKFMWILNFNFSLICLFSKFTITNLVNLHLRFLILLLKNQVELPLLWFHTV